MIGQDSIECYVIKYKGTVRPYANISFKYPAWGKMKIEGNRGSPEKGKNDCPA